MDISPMLWIIQDVKNQSGFPNPGHDLVWHQLIVADETSKISKVANAFNYFTTNN